MDDETKIPPTPALLLERYRIDGVLGEGGLGTVYKAYDTRLKRFVAVKTLKRSVYRDDPVRFSSMEERFQREAEAGSRMHVHPNLVVVHDFVTDTDKSLYLVQEFVPGGTLADRISREGALPQGDALRLAADVARGLAAAHEVHIVHRDIKPANIFLSADGRARVGDFGIAQLDDLSGRTRATTGHPGTPLYMSPEQAASTGYVRPESDQYSLGLVLFEMLTGQTFRRLRKSQADELLARQPQPIQALIRRILADNPEDRYESMAVVAAEIGGMERQLASTPTIPPPYRRVEQGGVRDTPPVNLQPVPVVAAGAWPPAAPPARTSSGRRVAIAAASMLVLAIAAAVIFALTRTAATPSPSPTVVAAVATDAPSPVATAPPPLATIPAIVAAPAAVGTPTLPPPPPTATPVQAVTPQPPATAASPTPGATNPTPPPSGQASGAPSASVDLSQAATAALPQGTSVKSISAIDLAGDGQVQALVLGEETPISELNGTNDVAALVAWQSNRWNVVYRTEYKAASSYVAGIDGYAKSNTHPGFVVVTSGSHGVSSTSRGFAVFRWDGGKATKVLERPTAYKAQVTADAGTGTVTFRAPVYRGGDPNCCPSYNVSSTWKWDGNGLQVTAPYTLENLQGSNVQVPAWLAKDGPRLFAMLASAKGDGFAFSENFGVSTAIRGLDGKTCAAPGGVVAGALGAYPAIESGPLWETSGTYRAVVYIAPPDSKTGQRSVSPFAKVGSCSLGGQNVQGYLLHITPQGDALVVDTIEAIAGNATNIAPADAVNPLSL